MKHFFIVLLLMLYSFSMFAQKHNLYADAGLSLYGPRLGFSITYNYKIKQWLALGGGVQGYKFHPTEAYVMYERLQFIPAIFADVHFYFRPDGKNQFFSFLDLGIDFYSRSDSGFWRKAVIYNAPNNNGFYTGPGFGYFRNMTKHGAGPYATIKMLFNWYKVDGYHTILKEHGGGAMGSGTIAVSLGFKF